jgi:YfiH family protein
VPLKTRPETQSCILRSKTLTSVSWLIHGFSTRLQGTSRVYGRNSLNLGFTKQDSRAFVQRNRMIFQEQLGAKTGKKLWPLVTMRQIHSDLIHCVGRVPEEPLAGDGLITATPQLLLGVLTADCIPVIVVDTRKHAVGVFHAGWRGTVKRIVQKGVGQMQLCFGSRPRDIKAVIGPGVHNCCYTVGEEVRAEFETQFAYADKLFHEVSESDPIRDKYPLLFMTKRAPGHSELPSNIFLNLVEANRRQLMDAGLSPKNIESSPLCTSCRTDLLFSHRKENGITGRMMAPVGIKK